MRVVKLIKGFYDTKVSTYLFELSEEVEYSIGQKIYTTKFLRGGLVTGPFLNSCVLYPSDSTGCYLDFQPLYSDPGFNSFIEFFRFLDWTFIDGENDVKK